MEATAPAAAPTPGNFMDHVAQDSGPDNIPDRSPQIPDTQPPKEPRLPEPEIGDEPVPLEGEDPDADNSPDEEETLRALKAELDAGDALPKSLENRTYPVKINGNTFELPISEIAQGYQRNADYSRKLAEVQQVREQAQNMQNGARALLNDLGNPETFVAALKELNLYEPFIVAAKAEGRRRLQMRELHPEAQQYAMQLEKERDLREAASRKAQQLEARMQEFQKAQPDENSIRLKHQLDQLVPRAFTKHKVGDYPLARDLFSRNLDNLYEGGDVTAQLVDSAAQATAEQLADIAQRLPKQSANDNGRTGGTMNTRRASPAPGKPVARQKGGTSTDFATHLARLNGSR